VIGEDPPRSDAVVIFGFRMTMDRVKCKGKGELADCRPSRPR
jgi:hypothetical protein